MEQKNLIFIGGGLILLLLLFFVFTGDGCGKKRFSWRETYEADSREPYGAFVFYELLKDAYGEENFVIVEDSLSKVLTAEVSDDARKSNYVFLGPGMYFDSLGTQALLSFVEQGNNAFLSSKTVPYDLMFYLYYDECYETYWEDYALIQDTSAQFNLVHPAFNPADTFTFFYQKSFKAAVYNWNYIDPNVFCESENSFTELGKMNDFYPNFARVPYGEGYFYLHTTPPAFSNFSLQKKENLAYAERVLSHLDGERVYYDRKHAVAEGVSRRRNERENFFEHNRSFENEGELSYILAQPPLRWAWYLTLGLALLYLIFRAKRQQRIIPVTEENRNTSLEFVGTIGQLYFQQENHKKLAEQKFRLWLNFVKEKYRLAGKELNEEFEKKLAGKSDVPQSIIHDILQKHRVIKGATGIHAHTLTDFHLVMEEFYRRAK